ncbi:MAG: hypothetical protein V7K21_22865 [Nostoc sp.]|uniref:hypothetical protein n=1 Tax=Nostoc sp. TaxID=1180 RepID=UPI002FF6D77F
MFQANLIELPRFSPKKTQSSNALESISEFAKELAEELRNRPEVKVCFGVNENISAHELVNEIFLDLLTNNL